MVQLSHPYMTTRKTTALTRQTFAGKGISLLCNMLSRFVIAFFPRNKCIFMAAVTICNDFGAPQNKVCHCFHSIPIYLPWSDGTKCHDFVFWMLSSKPAFSLSSLTFIKKLFRKKKKKKFFRSFSLSGITCRSAVIDTSPSNLDSSLCFIQPSTVHDILCI